MTLYGPINPPVTEPGLRAARTAALAMIAGAHVALIVALASAGAMQVVTHATQALTVELIPAPQRVVEVRPSVPPPNLRPPEIRLPSPPIENLVVMRMEETKPAAAPAPAPVAVAAVSAPAAPAPTLEPPRGDIAYLNNPAPTYPVVSRRSREQGRVMLRVRVDEKGNVEDVEVQASSGFARLDEAALAAVRHWRFLPARLGERAVAGWALVPINFRLRS